MQGRSIVEPKSCEHLKVIFIDGVQHAAEVTRENGFPRYRGVRRVVMSPPKVLGLFVLDPGQNFECGFKIAHVLHGRDQIVPAQATLEASAGPMLRLEIGVGNSSV